MENKVRKFSYKKDCLDVGLCSIPYKDACNTNCPRLNETSNYLKQYELENIIQKIPRPYES